MAEDRVVFHDRKQLALLPNLWGGEGGFTFGVAVLTGILFGLAPAWHASRADLNSLLKEASRGTTVRGSLRDVLVVAQVAAALILLVGSGLPGGTRRPAGFS